MYGVRGRRGKEDRRYTPHISVTDDRASVP